MNGRLGRWSPASGIVFVVLFVVGSVLTDQAPSIDDSDESIVAFYTDNGHQVKLQVAYLVLTLAAVFLVWYVGTLASRLSNVEGHAGWASRIAAVSGAACVSVMIVGYALGGMVADIGDDTDAFTVDPDTARLMLDVSYTLSFETALPLAAPMVLATSLVGLRTNLLPRWLGRAGVGVSVLCLVGFLGVPMGLFLLWIVAVAVTLIRRASGPGAMSESGAGTT